MEGISYPRTAEKFLAQDGHKWSIQIEILDKAFKYVTKWGTAIDGGAYVGTWALRMANRFRRVVAFEPLSANVECLKVNAPTVEIIPLALSREPGMETHDIKGAGYAELGKGTALIECTTIDSYHYDELGLIKLDVEGHERAALEGASGTIIAHRPVIVCEMKYEVPKVELTLKRFGYRKVEESKIDAVWIWSRSS